jgi:hypothetical protein
MKRSSLEKRVVNLQKKTFMGSTLKYNYFFTILVGGSIFPLSIGSGGKINKNEENFKVSCQIKPLIKSGNWTINLSHHSKLTSSPQHPT